ncbi:MAG: hypothetical protein ACK5OC_16820 [Pirellula sp.]|jgi:hypothetical protein
MDSSSLSSVSTRLPITPLLLGKEEADEYFLSPSPIGDNSMHGNNMIPDNLRTSTSHQTLPLEDTALARKPACKSTRREQSDEQNIEYNPSATACNAKDDGCWRIDNA